MVRGAVVASSQVRGVAALGGRATHNLFYSPITSSWFQRDPSPAPHLHFRMCRRFASTKVSALSLTSRKRQSKKFTMVTAYDYPSAVHVTRAGMDIILVGDSVGMVELGHDTTQPVTMDAMVHHCGSVRRGVDWAAMGVSDARIPLLVADMPLGSYEYRDTDVALRNAYRFIKEVGMDAVKLEVRLFMPAILSFTHQCARLHSA